MVNLNKDTVCIFYKSSDLFLAYQKVMFNQRIITINWLKKYQINSYAAFEAFVLSVFPYEDKQELLRFWSGNYPSEYIIDKITSVLYLIGKIDIKNFQSDSRQLDKIYYNSIIS